MAFTKQGKFFSLQNRILIVLILASTLPLLGMGSYFAWSNAKNKQKLLSESHQHFAEMTANQANTLFEDLRKDAAMIASLSTITHGTPEERQLLLEHLFINYDRYGQLAFIDPKTGDIMQSGTGPIIQIVNVSHIDSFQRARDEGRQAWVVAPPPLGGPLIFHMHTPVYRDNELIGILGSPIPLKPFRAIAEHIADHNLSHVLLVDDDGMVILDTQRAPLPDGNDEPSWPHFKHVMELEAAANEHAGMTHEMEPMGAANEHKGMAHGIGAVGEATEFVATANGTEEFIAYKFVPELDWVVSIEQPMNTVLAQSRLERNITLAGAGLLALICTLLAYLLSFSITQPLRRMTASLEAFGRGNPMPIVATQTGGIYEYQVLATAFDEMRLAVTDRETKLARAELENRSIIEAIPDSLCQLDSAGRIVSLKTKPPFDKIFGRYGDPIGQRMVDVIDKVSAALEEEIIWEQLKAEVDASSNARFECLIPLPDNDIHIESRLTAERDDGYLMMISDVTERKHFEVALQEAKDIAENANLAKSKFLSHMTHELRTPMNGVIGMTSLLYDTKLGDEQLDLVNTIRMSGDTMLAIINNILDFSKIEASKFELEKVSFDLQSCVDDAIDLVSVKARAKELVVTTNIDDSLPIWIVQDITRLRQILVNLLGNAVKFTNEGSVEISISADPARNKEQRIHFSIRDTGIGIPADRLDRLFQSFSQVDSSTSRRYGGTGLGLVICKRLCEMMGGTIAVESQENRGTTFRFSILAEIAEGFPLTEPTHRSPNSAEPVDFPPMKILLAEDNITNQKVAIGILKRYNLQADVVANGLEVLEAIDRQSYDVILMDVQMPEMNGLEATQRIRANQLLEKQPYIIALTANAMDQDRDIYLSQGMDGFVSKPIRVPNLLESLRVASTSPAHGRAAQFITPLV